MRAKRHSDLKMNDDAPQALQHLYLLIVYSWHIVCSSSLIVHVHVFEVFEMHLFSLWFCYFYPRTGNLIV